METLFLETISDCKNVNRTNFNSVSVIFMSSRSQEIAKITGHMWDTKQGEKWSYYILSEYSEGITVS